MSQLAQEVVSDSSVPVRSREKAPDLSQTKTLAGAAKLFFSYWGPRLLAAKVLTFLTIRLFLGPPTWVEGVVLAAIAVYWPLQEWAAHIWILHMKPKKIGRFKIDPYFAQTHRWHHRRPWDIRTSLLPLRVILPLAPINIAFWWLVTPSWAAACTGIAGFTAVTLFYEWIHYLVHTRYVPRGRYYRTIWKNHRLHHFKNENYWHSFTAPLVDVMFQTAPNPKDVEQSPTVRTLGVEEDDSLDPPRGPLHGGEDRR